VFSERVYLYLLGFFIVVVLNTGNIETSTHQ